MVILKMKISELAKACSISKDTIRYYISLGLLSPQRKNKQHVFLEKDVDDLLYIEKLKGCQFNLHEIEVVMRLRRTSNWVEPGAFKEFSLLLKEKRSELSSKIMQIQASVNMIDQELLDLFSKSEVLSRSKTGVPLRALPYLRCPRCGGLLQLKQANIFGKYVQSGGLACQCGYGARIEKGIVDTGNRYLNPYDSPDVNRDLYRTLCSGLLRMYQLCSGYIGEQLAGIPLTGKVVAEANVNGYFFLYNHFAKMPQDCLYIVADKYPQTVAMYKDLIERLGLDLDILYIADADLDWPLRKNCVDVCLDFFSSTEYQFYHENSFLHDVEPFLADKAAVIGSYIDLPPSAQTRRRVKAKYPESSSRIYTFSAILQELQRQNFSVASRDMGAILKTQNRFSFECHVNGEEMRFYVFRGDKR